MVNSKRRIRVRKKFVFPRTRKHDGRRRHPSKSTFACRKKGFTAQTKKIIERAKLREKEKARKLQIRLKIKRLQLRERQRKRREKLRHAARLRRERERERMRRARLKEKRKRDKLRVKRLAERMWAHERKKEKAKAQAYRHFAKIARHHQRVSAPRARRSTGYSKYWIC